MSTLQFNPLLTPSEMLREGIFGGSYFGIEKLEGDCEYSTLFETYDNVDTSLYLGETYKPKMNKFKIRSGMNYAYWRDMKWMHKDDPYGWFEWYTKYHNGRRHSDDNRQIQRWQEFCGSNGRWRTGIYTKIHNEGNWNISPRIQQSLLHWGYKVNEKDYETFCFDRQINSNAVL